MARKKQHVIVDAVHVPTQDKREQVCKLIACGLTVEEIAFVFGAMEHEIRAHYEHEIKHGMAAVVGLVGGAMLRNALGGDTNAQRAFLQMRARWTVPQHVELTGKDGGPVQVEHRKQTIARILGLVGKGQNGTEQGQTQTAEGQNAPVN